MALETNSQNHVQIYCYKRLVKEKNSLGICFSCDLEIISQLLVIQPYLCQFIQNKVLQKFHWCVDYMIGQINASCQESTQ